METWTLVAAWLVRATAFYLVVGVFFAVPFIFRGVNHIDPSAQEGTRGFRLLILPGTIAFWPLLARRWVRRVSEPPPERNAHRARARMTEDVSR